MPLTSQLTAVLLVPETVALNACDCPTFKLVLAGETETETETGELIVTVAFALAVDCATLCAVTVTELAGAAEGATYKPDGETVPTLEFPPSTPLTSQFSPVLLVPDTDPVNCWDCPVCRLAEPGVMFTEILEPPWPRW